METNIWNYQDSWCDYSEEAYSVAECLFCTSELRRNNTEETELSSHLAYDDLIGRATGYSGMEVSASVGTCPVCGWWKYIRRLNFIAPVGYTDIWDGAVGVLKNLDIAEVKGPLDELRLYLAARYESRFKVDPNVFERVVGDVFKDLGYATRVTARSGDDGIDVVLDGPNDTLIGVQVKRYKNSIKVEQIRSFTGALVIGGFTKGIFVTTSDYQSGAERTANLSAAKGWPIKLMNARKFYDSLKLAQIRSYDDESVVKPWSVAKAELLRRAAHRPDDSSGGPA